MEEFNKNQAIFILVLLNLIFFIATVSLGRQVHKKKTALVRETNLRFNLEEKEAGFNKVLSQAQDNIKVLEKSLEEEKALYQEASKDLVATREELEKVNKLKEKLEENLKEALVKNKK
jgi:regulatory protein YycI of two-component signal transduction system YycFG